VNSSHEFTKYDLEKISESIRAYCYLILTSQASDFFYDNLEDVINKSVSLQENIGRYQSTLKYARSRLDYSVGKGSLQTCC